MTKTRDIMSPKTSTLADDATVVDAAKTLAKEPFGALPICDNKGRLRGVLSDHDLVVEVLAAGRDPKTTTLAELFHGNAVSVGADDPLETAIATMKSHHLRRLPVVDGTDLVGMLSQADIAQACTPTEIGDLVTALNAD